jgi:hypothetical protein
MKITDEDLLNLKKCPFCNGKIYEAYNDGILSKEAEDSFSYFWICENNHVIGRIT